MYGITCMVKRISMRWRRSQILTDMNASASQNMAIL